MELSTVIDAILKIRAAKTDAEMASATSEFQRLVWDSETISGDTAAVEVVRELAYDLDYFEPDLEKRTEDDRYFGSDRLTSEVEQALQKLNVTPA